MLHNGAEEPTTSSLNDKFESASEHGQEPVPTTSMQEQVSFASKETAAFSLPVSL